MRIIHGDITDVTHGAVCHQVNCMGKIGAGVSGAIINKWPAVAGDYNRMCMITQNPYHLLGNWYAVRVPGDVTVYNIFSQYRYGNSAKTGEVYTDMDALVKALKAIAARHDEVYVPYGIGCGLAGGNWDELCNRLADVPNITAVRKG